LDLSRAGFAVLSSDSADLAAPGTWLRLQAFALAAVLIMLDWRSDLCCSYHFLGVSGEELGRVELPIQSSNEWLGI
jgi:hypothetical protein